jgi:hypothetical protein
MHASLSLVDGIFAQPLLLFPLFPPSLVP